MEETVEGYARALEVYREFEDWYGTGQVFRSLAAVHGDAGRPAEARACWLRAADDFTRAGDTAKADRARTWAKEQQ